MAAGLSRWSVRVVWRGVVVVDIGPVAVGGIGECIAPSELPRVVLEGTGVFVVVDADPGVEIPDGLEPHVGVTQEVGEALDQSGTDPFDAGDAALGSEGVVGEVDMRHRPGAEGREVSRREVGQPSQGVGGVRRLPRRCRVVRAIGVGDCVADKESQQVGGAHKPSQGEGAQLVTVVVVALGQRKDVGDAVDHGVDPDGIAVGDPGNDVAETRGISAGEGDVAPSAFDLKTLRFVFGVGLDGLGAGKLEHYGGGLAGDGLRDRTVDETDPVRVEVSADGGDFAGDPGLTVEPEHDLEGEWEPVTEIEDVGDLGAKGRVVISLAQANSARANSRMAGVPSPPGWIIRSRARAGVSGSSTGRSEWRSAQCATSNRSCTSAWRRARIDAPAATSVAAASRPARPRRGPSPGCESKGAVNIP